MHAQNSTTPIREKDLAQTRWEDIRHIARILGAACTLDACATHETSKANSWFGPDAYRWFGDGHSDGLGDTPWHHLLKRQIPNNSPVFVFCNPGFSNIAPWFKRCVEESEHYMVVGCCPNDPSVSWWEKYVEAATFVIVPSGKQARRTFLRPDGREFTSIDTTTGKEKLVSPTSGVCFPVWCKPRVTQPIIIRSQFPIIERKL